MSDKDLFSQQATADTLQQTPVDFDAETYTVPPGIKYTESRAAAQQISISTDEVVDIPYATASLMNWKEYFRTNNKYKDWDPKNPQRVMMRAIVEKDGTTTDVTILKKCDEESLNKEAFRLIQDAKANGAQIDPAKNADGNPVRSKWTIIVEFPPK